MKKSKVFKIIVGCMVVVVALTFAFGEKKKHNYQDVFQQRVTTVSGTIHVDESAGDIWMFDDTVATMGAITLPFVPHPVDKQMFGFSTRSAISNLTIDAASIPISGAITSLPANGTVTYSYSEAGNRWFIIGTPTVTSVSNPTFNNTPSVTIQTVAASGNGNQLSATKNVEVSYSVTIVSTATISGSQSGYVALEICPTNSSTAGNWIEISRVTNGQAVSLAVVLQSVSTGGGVINGMVPAGYYRRLRSVNAAGTPSYTYNSGQEISY